MEIPRAAIRRYSEELTRTSAKAGQRMRQSVETFMRDNPEATVAEVRDYSIAAADAIVAEYGNATAAAAARTFDEVMAAEGVTATPPAQLYDGPDVEAIDRGVHYQARLLTKDKREQFANEMSDLVSYHVRAAANKTEIYNVERANQFWSGRKGAAPKVRYARVPVGAETCTFCAMLAARGFAYWSAKSAGHADHRGCDCLVVPGIPDKTTIDGYDLETVKRVWQEFDAIDKAEYKDENGNDIKGPEHARLVRERKAEAKREILGRDSWDSE